MSDYLDPKGTEEFFDFVLSLEETRYAVAPTLYCKTVELRRKSFIYYPAIAIIVNEETLALICSKLKEIGLSAEVSKEQELEDGEYRVFDCIIKNIKQQEQQQ